MGATSVAGATSVPTVSPATSSVSTVADPVGLLASVDLADSDTLLPLLDGLRDPGLLHAAEAALGTHPTGSLQFAAALLVVNSGGDGDLLVPLIADTNPTIRVMAGTGLIAQGRLEGFAPLIAALTDDTILDGHYPAQHAWEAATLALVRWTGLSDNGPPFDAAMSQRASAQERWSEWLGQHRATLTFDTAEGRWRAP
jgi:hypothetical protein